LKTPKQFTFLLAPAFLVGVCLSCQNHTTETNESNQQQHTENRLDSLPKSRVRKMSWQAFVAETRNQKVAVLDARSRTAFNAKHLPGAIFGGPGSNPPEVQLLNEGVKPTQTIYLVGDENMHHLLLLPRLISKGFTDITVVEGSPK